VVILFINKFSAVAKIDHKDLVCLFTQANQKVGRVDIVVDQIFGMDPLNPVNELVHNEQRCLERKLALTKLKEMF
jgi:hypothetical protein